MNHRIIQMDYHWIDFFKIEIYICIELYLEGMGTIVPVNQMHLPYLYM